MLILLGHCIYLYKSWEYLLSSLVWTSYPPHKHDCCTYPQKVDKEFGDFMLKRDFWEVHIPSRVPPSILGRFMLPSSRFFQHHQTSSHSCVDMRSYHIDMTLPTERELALLSNGTLPCRAPYWCALIKLPHKISKIHYLLAAFIILSTSLYATIFHYSLIHHVFKMKKYLHIFLNQELVNRIVASCKDYLTNVIIIQTFIFIHSGTPLPL